MCQCSSNFVAHFDFLLMTIWILCFWPTRPKPKRWSLLSNMVSVRPLQKSASTLWSVPGGSYCYCHCHICSIKTFQNIKRSSKWVGKVKWITKLQLQCGFFIIFLPEISGKDFLTLFNSSYCLLFLLLLHLPFSKAHSSDFPHVKCNYIIMTYGCLLFIVFVRTVSNRKHFIYIQIWYLQLSTIPF